MSAIFGGDLESQPNVIDLRILTGRVSLQSSSLLVSGAAHLLILNEAGI